MSEISTRLQQLKNDYPSLLNLTDQQRNQALLDLATRIEQQAREIINANALDLAKMSINDPKYDRLKLTSARINAIAADVRQVASLTTPLGIILEQRTLANGLDLQKIRVPLGVVALIYEARPNVTIDVFSLCFKSGNAVVLKGGSEAINSNQILVELIKQSLQAQQINPEIVYLMPPERAAVYDLLNAVGLVDVCIPRGSKNLIQFVRENAKIPVIETGAGIVHTYFDHSGDVSSGAKIINNAKTRRISVCNALDTLIIHRSRLAELAELVAPLIENQVIIYADTESYRVLEGSYPAKLLKSATAEDFGREFLDYKLAIKCVDSLEEAIKHIQQYSSGHSEAIISNDPQSIEQFINQIDAAVVYINASTAFTDGGEFGMGAEIGISTQKLHARGPMALPELTSYKWIVRGNGQTR
ncbi:MAG: glutamate-5-semialdehyde dehydrogenase [Burkholderiales bacterium]|nr:glutamate-5-semialdehyde dehydrogenase [Burkholderiales bacterium]